VRQPLSRALIGLAVAGVAFGFAVAYVVAESDHTDDRGVTAALALLVGWSFIGTGLFAWWRRPANRTGALMVAVGFAWFTTSLSASDDDLLYTIGIALDGLFLALLGHLLLAFPTGRLAGRAERTLVAAIYVSATVLQVPGLLFEADSPSGTSNLMLVEPDQDLSDLLDALQAGIAAVLIVASFIVIARRPAAVTAAQRAALAPVFWTGGATLVAFLAAQTFDAAGSPQDWLERLLLVLLATVPFGFLAGLLRSRLVQAAAVSELVARLSEPPGEGALRAALAEALGDPTLALAYWLPESERFVDWAGRPMQLREGEWTEVEVRGRRVAAIVHHPSLNEEPQLVRTAGAAAALALENQRLSAELRARIEELRTSRARLVEATDAERRRLERNLHDGAQSRLVALALHLRLTRRKADGEVATMLDEAVAELQSSLDELRELARGIHPAVLTDRGLEAALRTLADRAPVPVDVTCSMPDRLPAGVETAVYFVVAEALTNVAKYAQAEHATVRVTGRDGTALVEVADDGRGGADVAAGSGLRGLADRVAALDGRLEVASPPGGGTRVRAEIPTG
jgi:signal transduction histidine kinase